jgi:SHS2 domain-containing protein
MTNDQINAAIAKALGWRVEDGVYMWTEHGIDKTAPLSMWDYCNDLNAMHEAEKVLDETQAEDYEELLGEYGFHSTARQRAEAFLMTLGKWKEVQP